MKLGDATSYSSTGMAKALEFMDAGKGNSTKGDNKKRRKEKEEENKNKETATQARQCGLAKKL